MVVASAEGASETETIENSYAVAAGIQNLLLMAESMGYAALWGSPAKGSNTAIVDFCGLESSDTVMGLIYIGVPTQSVAPVDRPPARINYLQEYTKNLGSV
jgi:nitroreductase